MEDEIVTNTLPNPELESSDLNSTDLPAEQNLETVVLSTAANISPDREVYDRDLVKSVLLESNGDLIKAAELLSLQGFDDSSILEIGQLAAVDSEILNDEVLGSILQNGLQQLTKRSVTASDSVVTDDNSSDVKDRNQLDGVSAKRTPLDESGNPIATPPTGNLGPMTPMGYDQDLARQVLLDAEGDLGKAAEALLARGFDMDSLKAFGEIALKDQDLINDPDVGSFLAPAPVAPVAPIVELDEFGNPPTMEQPVYDSRFETEQDAIQYAEENGQGALTSGADGELYNRFGEKMVYDSSGNLAPAPRDIPVGMVADPNNPSGFIADENWVNPDAAIRDESGNPIATPPTGEQPFYDSRFETEQDAIQHAEESGQGTLNSGADGELYNRFGEKMVYDSSGNLAPAPRDTPVGDDSNWDDPGYVPPDDPGYVPPDPVDPGYVPPDPVGVIPSPMPLEFF